jgi:hypothetical protein
MGAMPDERARRLALNESAFRVANERVNGWPERREASEPAPYYCECSDLECREQVMLDLGEYEQLRADPQHFAVVPGHEVPDVETVVESTQRYAVVQKAPDVAALMERTDPRTDA